MKKTLADIRADFIAEVVFYLSSVCCFEGDELAVKTSAYLDWNWPIVKSCFESGEITGTGMASDFTCDFICRMLAGRV